MTLFSWICQKYFSQLSSFYFSDRPYSYSTELFSKATSKKQREEFKELLFNRIRGFESQTKTVGTTTDVRDPIRKDVLSKT